MKKHLIVATAIMASGLSFVAAGAANATDEHDTSHAMETKALMSAKLTAADAIKAVQAEQPGKVAEVQFTVDNNAPAYEISLLAADGTEHDFLVDASAGVVTKMAANEEQAGDQADDENDHETGGAETD
ncbi:PepSY domain-containing protein [Hoeflea sp. AS60]|uniref:PepSY domain-containing protein n=1 Tax=Hoeflea sp. AS60 TaxID=3135780 RepID=UPI003179BD96